jgi:protein O-GlcNAc transferase
MTAATATLLEQAIALYRQDALDEAAARYQEVLRQDPANADALYALAQIACQQGRLVEGVEFARKVLASDPNRARAHKLLGLALARLGRPQEALASLDSAIAQAPALADVHGSRGDVLAELGRHGEAVESYDRALAVQPDSVADWSNRGAALVDLGRHADALESFERALALAPDFAQAHFNRGNALGRLNRPEEAISSYRQALAINPHYVEALNNCGNVLRDLGRIEEALASFERAVAVKPNDIAAHNNRAIVLNELGRSAEALLSAEQALAIDPDNADALFTRANALVKLRRYDDAVVGYQDVLAADPKHRIALGALAQWSAATCDWSKVAAFESRLRDQVNDGRAFVSPMTAMTYSLAPSDLLKCSQNFVRQEIAERPRFTAHRHSRGLERIRIAYLSADFNSHPLPYLMAELFEIHDRQRFEIIGVSFGADDGSDIRARVVRAFDQFHDVAAKSDSEIARLVNDLAIDIAVDLNGYTESARPTIFAQRPAPIQASYLGFLGTMGADFIDYVIVDEVVVPPESESFYSERIVRLPGCFQVNDSTHKISARTPSRTEAGLPERGFVFCCFNGHYKITAPVFDIWMGLLKAIDGSVLWLIQSNEVAAANLRREALARGVDPVRLVFAPRMDPVDHLARHRLADVFLDTLPINAGATASDALWAGLPIVTRIGETFPGRMSASLLHAIGLPELVTRSIEDYQALALRLAGDPVLLAAIRRRLNDNRRTTPLFDTDRSRRHIEAAYTTMCEIHRRGESPRSFRVEPL